MSEDFNANSTDAMFSRILARLEEQDRKADADRGETREYRRALDARLDGHGQRIASLEDSRSRALGFAAGAGGITGWIASLFK